MESSFQTIYPLEYYLTFLNKGIRPDGRTTTQSRPLEIHKNSISSAEGSSFVKIGNTFVNCGIKAEIGIPPADQEPVLAINVELLPICSKNIRPGKPTDQAQYLSSTLNSLCGNIISREELLIENESLPLSWFLYVDVYCLNYDGNLLDASLLSVLAALESVSLPSISVTLEGNIVVAEGKSSMLNLQKYPVASTFATLEEYVITDPTFEEEELMSGSFTIVYDQNNKLCSVLKSGGSIVSDEVLQKCMKLSLENTTIRLEQVTAN
eukprot:TRINITY_DN4495_c0_g1_i1.p1 TRINITY_DN4495_c0_g1~~TRINITY_DN4495_c0_g1_i1.p1  ORF type:complete len:266 (+),score=46.71 TRINITY_DN4495_c0_g1_i1:23-820(+)